MKNTVIVATFLSLSIVACNKYNFDTHKNEILEGFEDIATPEQLLATDNWEYYQQTEAENFIEIDTLIPHSGNQCLKLFAVKGTISKSDLANNKMTFWEDDVVIISAWYYLSGTESLGYLFLFDIEENTAIGASPGLRFALNDEGFLYADRSKIGESPIRQDTGKELVFPRNQWVKLKIEILLKQKNGYLKLWQDDQLLLDAAGIQTLPKDRLYFIQGTKSMYQSIQIGVTASTSANDVTLYIDDVEIWVK